MTIRDVPIGAVLTITEEETDYATSMTLRDAPMDGNSIEVQEGGNSVVVTNTLEAVPDTGIVTDGAPYVLMLIVASVIALCAGVHEPRDRNDR